MSLTQSRRGFLTGLSAPALSDDVVEALTEIPYNVWRDFDPEDTVRFFAIRLHEARMVKSGPQEIISKGTNWTFLNEVRRELKA
jgi:NitT/TauT family transport system substrate-binding protein